MLRLIVASLVSLSTVSLSTAISMAQVINSDGGTTPGTISVLGEGIVTATPDVFILEAGVMLNDLDLEKLQAELRQRCGAVVKAAQPFKLDKARTFTREYTITPRYDNTSRFLDYYVTQKFRFALSDLNQAEALTTAVVKAGATTIESIEFTVAESSEIWETAREQAVENAFKRATRMTKVIGSKPGRPRTINDQGNQLTVLGCAWNPKGQDQTTVAGSGLPEGDRAFFVSPTAVKFQARVQAQFEIVPL